MCDTRLLTCNYFSAHLPVHKIKGNVSNQYVIIHYYLVIFIQHILSFNRLHHRFSSSGYVKLLIRLRSVGPIHAYQDVGSTESLTAGEPSTNVAPQGPT